MQNPLLPKSLPSPTHLPFSRRKMPKRDQKRILFFYKDHLHLLKKCLNRIFSAKVQKLPYSHVILFMTFEVPSPALKNHVSTEPPLLPRHTHTPLIPMKHAKENKLEKILLSNSNKDPHWNNQIQLKVVKKYIYLVWRTNKVIRDTSSVYNIADQKFLTIVSSQY